MSTRYFDSLDPNAQQLLREFIITTIAIILIEYEHHLPHSLVSKIDIAIRKAVGGALKRGLRATYTNIALMNAFMLCFAGDRLDEPVWVEAGEASGPLSQPRPAVCALGRFLLWAVYRDPWRTGTRRCPTPSTCFPG